MLNRHSSPDNYRDVIQYIPVTSVPILFLRHKIHSATLLSHSSFIASTVIQSAAMNLLVIQNGAQRSKESLPLYL